MQKTLSEKTPNPSQAISFIRTTTQQYASLVPGVKQYIDPVFEELDSLSESHGQEVNEILSRTYNELKETISNGGLDKQTGEKVADIIKRRAVQLKDLAKDASSKVLDDNPQLKEKVGGSLDELKKYAKSYGPEAQKVVDETYQQIQDIVSEGMSPSAVSKAMSLVQQKRQQIMDMGSKAAEKAWEQGSQQAQSYLDRSPELKKLFDEKKDDLKRLALGGGISTASIPQIFSKVRDVASSGDSSDSVDKLRQYLDSTTKQGQSSLSSLGSNLGSLQDSSSWEGTLRVVQNYLKSIPGGEEVCWQEDQVEYRLGLTFTVDAEAVTERGRTDGDGQDKRTRGKTYCGRNSERDLRGTGEEDEGSEGDCQGPVETVVFF